jgi:hypothetical protein
MAVGAPTVTPPHLTIITAMSGDDVISCSIQVIMAVHMTAVQLVRYERTTWLWRHPAGNYTQLPTLLLTRKGWQPLGRCLTFI